MTTETRGVSANRDETAVVRGRPFLPGNNANPNGRPRKTHAIRDILKSRPVKDKRALVDVAYAAALEGDVHWAEWIVKHSGESGSNEDGRGGLVAEMIIRCYEGWPEKLT